MVTALTVFPFRFLALRIGMVDHPDSFRKLQRKPIPVGGGAVIFLIMVVMMILLTYHRETFDFRLGLSEKLLLPLIIVSPFIIVLGLIDDKFGVSGRTKLLFQIISASVIIGFAKYYSEVTYFGIELNLHHLFYPMAVFWIIGMINAINLLDGADGVAVTVGFYMSLATAGISYINSHFGIMLISLGLAGCLLGFFVHNRPPAGVYLGDTGSMFIGMVLATLMLRASVASDRTISICGAFAIVLIPAVDSFFAVIRRVNSGRTIFSPDRGHIHHLLTAKFSSGYMVLLILSLLIIPGCVAAVLGTYYRNDLIPALISLGVLSIAIVTDLFGRRELFILLGRIKGRFRKLFDKQKYQSKNGEIYHIQGKGPWRQMWNKIIPILHNYPCRCLQLDINIPCKHE
ncbi:MAG: undecaprenyl/decaprenyl-phosphate alpha-N-acetylglucosaminyl 1-phosphate transferase, partial [Planctomycetaceae bacterium]|nr:undecaprenyl/decaprenyl-phosphate alpha-N-acetylglucosaminyl 1-phosphate transferase [Planctomycetaceae bacterium]